MSETNLNQEILTTAVAQSTSQTSSQVPDSTIGSENSDSFEFGDIKVPGVVTGIWDHVYELQRYILGGFLAWILGVFATTPFTSILQKLVLDPLRGQALVFQSPSDSVLFLFKIHTFAGFIVALPIMLFIVWKYVTPILQQKEKKSVLIYILAFVFLTVVGILYAYLSLIPASLGFLLGVQVQGITFLITASEYMNFLISMFLVLILVFQMPMALFALIRTRILPSSKFESNRRLIYFILVIILAILTPTPDIFTLVLIIVPVIALFEIALQLAKLAVARADQKVLKAG